MPLYAALPGQAIPSYFDLFDKNNIVVAQGLEKAEEVMLGIGLGLLQDSVFQGGFANLFLGSLAGQGFQILDTPAGKEPTGTHKCGALYDMAAPEVSAARPAGG